MTENKFVPVAQPASDCPDCKGTGDRDSGGTQPWGEAIYVPCDCSAAAPAPVALAGEFEAWYATVVKYVEPADIAAWMHDAWDAGRASAPAPVARLLTDKEIEAGRHETFSTSNPFCPCTDKTMRKAVRWAERACARAWGVKLTESTGQEDNNGKVPRL